MKGVRISKTEANRRWRRRNPAAAKAKAKRNYENRKRRGRCVLCVNAAIPGRIHCVEHVKKRAAWSRQRNTGAPPGWFEKTLAEQGGVCAICRGTSDQFGADHNHKTMRPRAVLCRNCNTGLGSFREDVGLLAAAIAYLALHEGLGSAQPATSPAAPQQLRLVETA